MGEVAKGAKGVTADGNEARQRRAVWQAGALFLSRSFRGGGKIGRWQGACIEGPLTHTAGGVCLLNLLARFNTLDLSSPIMVEPVKMQIAMPYACSNPEQAVMRCDTARTSRQHVDSFTHSPGPRACCTTLAFCLSSLDMHPACVSTETRPV